MTNHPLLQIAVRDLSSGRTAAAKWLNLREDQPPWRVTLGSETSRARYLRRWAASGALSQRHGNGQCPPKPLPRDSRTGGRHPRLTTRPNPRKGTLASGSSHLEYIYRKLVWATKRTMMRTSPRPSQFKPLPLPACPHAGWQGSSIELRLVFTASPEGCATLITASQSPP